MAPRVSFQFSLVHKPLTRGALAFEAYLSTQPTASGQDARIPCAHADSRRPCGTQTPAPEGPSPINSVRSDLSPYAFPRNLRILRRSDFQRAYEEGKRRSTSLCTVFFRPNGLSQSRLGITTPARLGKAVVRNRLKRRFRAIYRLNRAAIPGGWDIVVNPRECAVTATFESLAREFLRVLPSAPPTLRGAVPPP